MFTLLDTTEAAIIEQSHIDGLDQVAIAKRHNVTQSKVSKTLSRFDSELACIIGPLDKRTPGFKRDVITRLIGNATAERQRLGPVSE